jgi:hypothetical protein
MTTEIDELHLEIDKLRGDLAFRTGELKECTVWLEREREFRIKQQQRHQKHIRLLYARLEKNND